MYSNVRRELALRAAAHAERVRLECKIARTAPVDPLQIAEMRDCEVWFMALPTLEGVYSPSPRSTIVLGSQRPAGRRAFTCAHELGHHEFKHGERLDELNSARLRGDNDPDEFLANMFGAFLLMSQGSVRRALKDRQIEPNKIEPIQAFQIACYFGVGYGTLIDHMTWTLKFLSPQICDKLLKTQPKELKAQYGGLPQSETVLVDGLWRDRTVDLEIGDILVLHEGVVVEEGLRLIPQATADGLQTFMAASRGYIRAFHEDGDWAVNIRIASKHYKGLARYRFLDDPEEGIQ